MAAEREDGQPPCCIWEKFDKSMAVILGDLKDSPSPVKDPSPVRAVCRITFVVLLLTAYMSMLVYYYKDSPDVAVEQVQHLQPGQENYGFPIRELYDSSPESNMTWRNPIICPCSTISVRWRDFVSFYILHSNSTGWNVSLYPGSPGVSPSIYVPYLNGANTSLLSDHIVKDPNPVTADKFCSVSTMWPIPDANTSNEINGINGPQCVWLATSVFPGDFEDTTRSSTILETPTLLNREVFNMRVSGLAKDSVLKRRQRIDTSNQNSLTLRQYYNGLSDLLTGLLDRDLTDFTEWQSYLTGAVDLQQSLLDHVGFGWANPMVFLNRDADGLIFLHPEINWMTYYEACAPKYCDVTKPMSVFQKAYSAFGLLGGIASTVLLVVTVIVWPVTGKFLESCCTKRTNGLPAKSVGDTQFPQASIV